MADFSLFIEGLKVVKIEEVKRLVTNMELRERKMKGNNGSEREDKNNVLGRGEERKKIRKKLKEIRKM